MQLKQIEKKDLVEDKYYLCVTYVGTIHLCYYSKHKVFGIDKEIDILGFCVKEAICTITKAHISFKEIYEIIK